MNTYIISYSNKHGAIKEARIDAATIRNAIRKGKVLFGNVLTIEAQ